MNGWFLLTEWSIYLGFAVMLIIIIILNGRSAGWWVEQMSEIIREDKTIEIVRVLLRCRKIKVENSCYCNGSHIPLLLMHLTQTQIPFRSRRTPVSISYLVKHFEFFAYRWLWLVVDSQVMQAGLGKETKGFRGQFIVLTSYVPLLIKNKVWDLAHDGQLCPAI